MTAMNRMRLIRSLLRGGTDRILGTVSSSDRRLESRPAHRADVLFGSPRSPEIRAPAALHWFPTNQCVSSRAPMLTAGGMLRDVLLLDDFSTPVTSLSASAPRRTKQRRLRVSSATPAYATAGS